MVCITVLVVGEDDDYLRRHGIHRTEDIVGRGVHGLSAYDHSICARILEHGSDAVTVCDGYYAVLLFGSGRLGSLRLKELTHTLLTLQLHVVYLHVAQIPHGKAFLKGKSGVVGMHMDLDDIVVVYDYCAVAYALKVLPELCRLRVGGLAVDNVFGVLCVNYLFIITDIDVELALGLG